IPNKDDKCPLVYGLSKYQGCPIPDRDGDGVNDEKDKCVDVPGPKENRGCPLPVANVKKILDSAARQIFFETGKSTLLPASHDALKKILDILKSDSSFKLVIEGHTDNAGSSDANQLLSTNRAKAVSAFLEANDIPAYRLNAIGFGERQPIADNATAEGRAKNRRVELKIVTHSP
ncbi:MAG TPA: OmpA family protein, partial [Chitinophagaceae bacterium]|nr:OmpA family protein [Chitinophagaceae bacterium]